jgi:hypothetical protein
LSGCCYRSISFNAIDSEKAEHGAQHNGVRVGTVSYNNILWLQAYRKNREDYWLHKALKLGFYAGFPRPKAIVAIPAAATKTSPTTMFIILPPEVNIAAIPIMNNAPPAI